MEWLLFHMPAEFSENLPANCPPEGLPEITTQIVLRLVASAKPSLDDFKSLASLGLPRRGDTTACQHASCSAFRVDTKVDRARQLKKLPRIRNRNHVAFVSIGPACGVGLFSRSSSHVDLWFYKAFNPVKAIDHAEAAKQVFAIDGKWEASDFSRFYSKIADIYAFLYVVNRDKKNQLSQVDRGYIKHQIGGYFWKGGGSYVGFYDDIFDRVDLYDPLDVSKIAYASPGTIELEGNKDVFGDITKLLNTLEINFGDAKSVYNNLRGMLKQQRLLGADRNAKFRSKRLGELAKEQTDQLAHLMNISGKPIFDLCDDNIVVYSKVILSLFRRARDLFIFHAEGRVRPELLTSTSDEA